MCWRHDELWKSKSKSTMKVPANPLEIRMEYQESTQFHPVSPHAVAKTYVFWLVDN